MLIAMDWILKIYLSGKNNSKIYDFEILKLKYNLWTKMKF